MPCELNRTEKFMERGIYNNSMEFDKNGPCLCGSGKKYKECCLGHHLNLKGKKAEEFVYQLAINSFFTDWCYSNPKLPNGKEICDLLVVYDDVLIIWQIKDLKLDGEGRYNKSEVQKNLHQIFTARNRLLREDIIIELENPRRGKEIFNPKKISEIYLISALLGKGEDYFSGVVKINGKIIHTFTREFTELALMELDTIKDFIEYLREKENLISADTKIISMGEEKELLAYYLMNGRSFDNLKDRNVILIQDGFWKELQKRPEYNNKKREDEISYIWDSMINLAHTCGEGYEQVAKEMARTNRFERRLLSKAFIEAHINANEESEKDVFRRILQCGDTTYCYVFMRGSVSRSERKKHLATVCFIARGTNIFKKNKKVIGIATETEMGSGRSFDFCLLKIPEWSEEMEKEKERIQKETGVLKKFKKTIIHEDEYPNTN